MTEFYTHQRQPKSHHVSAANASKRVYTAATPVPTLQRPLMAASSASIPVSFVPDEVADLDERDDAHSHRSVTTIRVNQQQREAEHARKVSSSSSSKSSLIHNGTFTKAQAGHSSLINEPLMTYLSYIDEIGMYSRTYLIPLSNN